MYMTVKTSTFLHMIGPNAIEIFNTFQWTEVDDEELTIRKLKKF